jgi:hypothetical protein
MSGVKDKKKFAQRRGCVRPERTSNSPENSIPNVTSNGTNKRIVHEIAGISPRTDIAKPRE